jgi:hypothetical protein
VKAVVDILHLIAHRYLSLKGSHEGVKGICDSPCEGIEAHQFMRKKHCQWCCSLVSRLGEGRDVQREKCADLVHVKNEDDRLAEIIVSR